MRIITFWVCAMMIASAFVMVAVVNVNVGGQNYVNEGLAYVPHAPIYISGDTDFATLAGVEGWLGDGTSGNPYIIEGYDIDGSVDWYCIWVEYTSVYFVVRDCYLHSTNAGIYLNSVQNGILDNNTIVNNEFGIYLFDATGNIITSNTFFSSTDHGIYLEFSSGNTLYHNNFIDNLNQAYDDVGGNTWDDGYPSGGNYWSDYTGIDAMSGPLQDIQGADDIGDTPYTNIGGGLGAQDNYPLMQPWNPSSKYLPHQPIRIDSNGDFTPVNGVLGGNGSQANPWIIDGWDIDGTGFGYCIYIGYTTDYFVVRNCNLHDANGIGTWPYDSGLLLNNVQNGKVANTAISSSNNYGILLLSSSSNVISNNTASSNNEFGIFVHSSSGNVIFNNTASSNNNNGILLYSSSDSNIIANNTVSSNVNTGIALSTCNYNTIVNNTAFSNNFGIDIYQSSSNLVVNNAVFSNNFGIGLSTGSNDNTIEGNAVSLNNNNGINLWESGTGNTIVNNNAFSNNQTGIFLGSSSSGNTIANNNASSNGNFGIFLYSSSANNTIVNNTAWDNIYSGINFQLSSDNFVADNTVSNNWDGIRLESSTFNTLVNNTVLNNHDGISLYASSNDNTIESNTASTNIGNGIGINSCSNNTVESNTVSNNDFGIKLDYSCINTLTTNIVSSNNDFGIFLYGFCNDNNVANNIVSNSGFGVFLGNSSNGNTVESNTASLNSNSGIALNACNYNTIANNTVSWNTWAGINLFQSSSNIIVNNTALSNNYGMYLDSAISNSIYHNNFINNANQAYDNTVTNIWHNGYPFGGNYWSDYSSVDMFSGPGQNILGSDGIGDAPYFSIGGGMGQQDNYPLMTPAKTGIYFPHLPIRIDSNADFNVAHGVTGGDGSASAPWIIEEYNIDGTGYGYCIYIGNTTDYFIVRNCYLHDSNGVTIWPFYEDTGITMYNASNGLISNNEITRIRRGIYLYNGCLDNQVIRNNVSHSSWTGIHLSTHSDGNSVIGNHVSDIEGLGLSCALVENSVLRNNTIVNALIGLILDNSNITIIENISISNSRQYGLQAIGSINATIDSCSFYNDFVGVLLDGQTSDIHMIDTTIISINTGLRLADSNHNTLENLYIYGGTIGLEMGGSNENVISNVESRGGSENLQLTSSDSNVFTGSTFSNSQYGAIVQSSNNNMFADCAMENNTGQGVGVNTLLDTYETDLEVYQNDDNGAAYSSFQEQLAIGDGGNPFFTRAVDVNEASLFAVRIYGNMADVVDLDMGIFLDGKNGNPIDGQTQTGEFVQYGATSSSDESVTIINPQDGTYLIRVFGYAVLGNPGHFNMSISLYQIGSTGIALIESDYNTIYSCRMNRNAIGALVLSGNGNIIANNSVNSNGFGIYITYSNNNTISDNTASNNWAGIYLASSIFNTIANNTASSNFDIGISIYQSSSNIVRNNTASDNNCGIYLDSCIINIIATNSVSLNKFFGIRLFSSNNNTIINNPVLTSNSGIYLSHNSNGNTLANNTFSNNLYGIYIYYYSNSNTIVNNIVISNSQYGIYLYYGSNSNAIYHNNFIGNTNQAYDDGANIWHNGYPSGGNYWSDYTGIDAMNGPLQDIPGADDIGDTPYTNIGGGMGAQDNYPLMTPFGTIIFNNALIAGWNFISIPLVMGDTSVANVLSSISGSWDVVKYYDANDALDPWKTYRVGSSMNDLANIDITMGIWIHVTVACNLTVSGAIPVSTEIILKVGWNLVGYPSETGRLASDTLPAQADMVSVYQVASPYIQDFTELSLVTMSAGNGYWVHVTADCVWNVDW